MRVHLTTLAAIGCLALSPASAQTSLRDAGASPSVTTLAVAPVPSAASITLQPQDDNALNLAVGDMLARELRERGYTVGAGAPLLLRFSTSDDTSLSRRREPLLGELRGGTNQETQLSLNVYSNHQNALTGSPPETAPTIDPRFRLRATLDERPGGRRIWQGEAVGSSSDPNEIRRVAPLVPALLDGLGHTVSLPATR